LAPVPTLRRQGAVTDPAGIHALQDAIRHLHGVDSQHVETVAVSSGVRFDERRVSVGGLSRSQRTSSVKIAMGRA